MPHRHLVDAHVLLLRDGHVLLSRRRGDAFDGMWHLPSGKVEAAEDVVTAAARELAEEVGVRVAPADLSLVHTAHVTAPAQEPRFGLFFGAERWDGEPVNREPAKCHGLEWFPLTELPEPLISYTRTGLEGYLRGEPFSLLGWPA